MKSPERPEKPHEIPETNEETCNNIVEIIKLLASVEINSQEAKLNTTTISDGKGGRIFL